MPIWPSDLSVIVSVERSFVVRSVEFVVPKMPGPEKVSPVAPSIVVFAEWTTEKLPEISGS